jgi:hypothetical protein
MADHAKEVMQEDGLTLSPLFVFVRPYWGGREAALTPNHAAPTQNRNIGFGLALFFGALGVIRFARRHKVLNAARRPFEARPQISASSTATRTGPLTTPDPEVPSTCAELQAMRTTASVPGNIKFKGRCDRDKARQPNVGAAC